MSKQEQKTNIQQQIICHYPMQYYPRRPCFMAMWMYLHSLVLWPWMLLTV